MTSSGVGMCERGLTGGSWQCCPCGRRCCKKKTPLRYWLYCRKNTYLLRNLWSYTLRSAATEFYSQWKRGLQSLQKMTCVAGSPFQKAELNFTQLWKMAYSISEGMAGKPKENSLVHLQGRKLWGRKLWGRKHIAACRCWNLLVGRLANPLSQGLKRKQAEDFELHRHWGGKYIRGSAETGGEWEKWDKKGGKV